MLWIVDWLRYGAARARWRAKEHGKPDTVSDQGRATLITHRGDMLTCCHRIGMEQYVWRYRHCGTADALRALGYEAAKGGTFTFWDAALVSAAMRSVRDSMEAQGSAAGV